MSPRLARTLFVAVLAFSASLVNAAEGGAAELNYNQLGADWPGLCQTGTTQSPINIVPRSLVPYDKPEYEPRFEGLGTVENTTLFATSTLPHIEMKWKAMSSPMKVTLAADLDGNIFAPLARYLGEGNMKRVAIEPAQFHFHAPSEASVDGELYDGVIHIVNFVKDGESAFCDRVKAGGGLGCPVVIGIFLKADDSLQSSPLDAVFATSSDVLVTKTGKENGVTRAGSLILDSLLPKVGRIATYAGSLTTAPCTEGVFWISLLTPLAVTPKDIVQLKQTVMSSMGPDCESTEGGVCTPARVPDNNRVIQGMNHRDVRISNAF